MDVDSNSQPVVLHPLLQQVGGHIGRCQLRVEDDMSEPVELQPFLHQVGGHTSMFRFNEDTVCKPLCSREYQFYSTLPTELYQFTPECRGVVEVEVEAMDTNDVKLLARRVTPDCERSIITTTSPSQQYVVKMTTDKLNQRKSSHESVCNKSLSQTPANQNPWVTNIFHRQLRKFHQNSANKFMLLENMVAELRKPCVLDLKMGKRQYGDDALPEKIKLLQQRCKASTSSELGVRASGMQIYQVHSGEFIFRSKYDGRALTAEGFKDNLAQFLHDGCRMRVELLQVILTQLRDLKAVVETLNTYRFYSSSLLIIYDGDVNTADFSTGGVFSDHRPAIATQQGCHSNSSSDLAENARVQIKMVDFAHSTYQSFEPNDHDHAGPDLGYLSGLSTLIKMLQDLQQQHSLNR